jgi:hypothetical protein
LRRAREGVEAGQWKRVARAMDALLADSPWDDEALHLRGLAHAAMGELFDALALLGAAEKKVNSYGDAEVERRRLTTTIWTMTLDDDDQDDDELDDDEKPRRPKPRRPGEAGEVARDPGEARGAAAMRGRARRGGAHLGA